MVFSFKANVKTSYIFTIAYAGVPFTNCILINGAPALVNGGNLQVRAAGKIDQCAVFGLQQRS